MIWVSWRQSRTAAITLAAAVGALTVYLLIVGWQLRLEFSHLGLAACVGPGPHGQLCPSSIAAFYRLRNSLTGSGGTVLTYLDLVPALCGVFLGAPLLGRELEQGTYRLAWTQSVTRGRWLLWRLATVAAIAVTAEVVLSAGATFSRSAVDRLGGRFEPAAFDLEGIVPVGYALFAVTLGVAAGAVARRATAAMAVTLAVSLGVRIAVETWGRVHFLPVQTYQYFDRPPAGTPSGSAGDWILDTLSPRPGLHLPTIIVYQPADRFWTFQGIETGGYLLLAAALVVITVTWTRHHTP